VLIESEYYLSEEKRELEAAIRKFFELNDEFVQNKALLA
jgi:hypothetical protein